jgi:hypothetical protein
MIQRIYENSIRRWQMLTSFRLAHRLAHQLMARLTFFALLCSAPFAALASSSVIGEVSLVIGNVSVVSAQGVRGQAVKGMQVRIGDQIETQLGGHAHVRFVDGARISVRPASRLVIETYANPKQESGATGGIRFRLDEGAMRSITGGWGALDRAKFRLNTPVAAIGVKGTDFIVRAEQNRTMASVFTGEIILSPMTEACAGTLGPCVNGREKALSDAMKGQMLELRRADSTPQLVPAIDLLAAGRTASRVVLSTNSVSVENQSAAAASDNGTGGTGAAVGTPSGSTSVQPIIAETKVAEAINSAELRGPNTDALTWARYAWAPALNGDDYSVRFESALLAGRQKVSSDSTFVLLRDQSLGAVFAPVDSSARFRLATAAATVMRTDRKPNETVQVLGGTLDVDFARSSFVTQLQMEASRSGAQTVSASGGVTSDGSFRAVSSSGLVQGGFNLDGTQAGYQFQKAVPNGVLTGTTLWGR